MEMVASSSHASSRAIALPAALPCCNAARLQCSRAGSVRFAALHSARRRRLRLRLRPQCSISQRGEAPQDDQVRRAAALFLGSSALLLASGMMACRTVSAEEAIASASTSTTSENVSTREEKEAIPVEKSSTKKKSREEEEDYLDDLTRLHTLMEKRHMPAAIEILTKLINAHPAQLEFRFIRGHAYEYMGDLDNALKEFEDAVKMEPLSLRALQGLALVLKKQGKNIDFIQKIVEDAAAKAVEDNRQKDARNFRMLLGQILTLKEELPRALEHYEQLSKDDPTDFRPHLCQGLVCCMLGELDQAEEHFNNFDRYCPQYYEARDAIEELITRARADAKQRIEASSKQMAPQ